MNTDESELIKVTRKLELGVRFNVQGYDCVSA